MEAVLSPGRFIDNRVEEGHRRRFLRTVEFKSS